MIINSYHSHDFQQLNPSERLVLAEFLHQHLDQYGDSLPSILNCFDYVMNHGGWTFTLHIDQALAGVCIFNETHMNGYIPENILVYIAIDSQHRGKGLGNSLIEEALKHVKGDVALHVEANNPAKKLYEKLGFTNPYLEMRLKR
jgi:ribosomal-protein-alanine N-acetyltransferase